MRVNRSLWFGFKYKELFYVKDRKGNDAHCWRCHDTCPQPFKKADVSAVGQAPLAFDGGERTELPPLQTKCNMLSAALTYAAQIVETAPTITVTRAPHAEGLDHPKIHSDIVTKQQDKELQAVVSEVKRMFLTNDTYINIILHKRNMTTLSRHLATHNNEPGKTYIDYIFMQLETRKDASGDIDKRFLKELKLFVAALQGVRPIRRYLRRSKVCFDTNTGSHLRTAFKNVSDQIDSVLSEIKTRYGWCYNEALNPNHKNGAGADE